MIDRSHPGIACILLILASCLFQTDAFAQDLSRKGSPFDALRWKGETPEVLVGDEWFVPLSIHEVEVAEILEFCEKRWPGQVQKRFGEDLVEALGLMGHRIPKSVDLRLARLMNGVEVERKGVAITAAKREAIRLKSRGQSSTSERPSAPARLTREQARADLQAFAVQLEDRFAYQDLGGVNWKAELETIRKGLPEMVATGELAEQLQRLMARFKDGHASVRSVHVAGPEKFLPFLMQDAEGGVVAFRPDRSGFLDPKYPFILEIDGLSIDQWVERTKATTAAGSPQLVRRRGLRALRSLEPFRPSGDQPKPGTVTVRLSKGEGASSVERKYATVEKRPVFGDWPASKTGLLDGNVGYLRLAAMDDELVAGLHDAMTSFRETDGLIVDVRGNGGGSRSLLIALAGYLLAPDEGPWVGNVAKYILSEDFEPDHLEARYMYRASSKRWNKTQREAIDEFARDFQAEWRPPGKFSEWHYLVLDRTGHPSEYFYSKPVIVLSDSWCFSATDIFLGALKGRPRVTLMGSASGGGSARSQGFTLPHSAIEVRCASMASFRPDGRLYDGRGVEMDLTAQIQADDLLKDGTDSVLAAALAMIRDSAR